MCATVNPNINTRTHYSTTSHITYHKSTHNVFRILSYHSSLCHTVACVHIVNVWSSPTLGKQVYAWIIWFIHLVIVLHTTYWQRNIFANYRIIEHFATQWYACHHIHYVTHALSPHDSASYSFLPHHKPICHAAVCVHISNYWSSSTLGSQVYVCINCFIQLEQFCIRLVYNKVLQMLRISSAMRSNGIHLSISANRDYYQAALCATVSPYTSTITHYSTTLHIICHSSTHCHPQH